MARLRSKKGELPERMMTGARPRVMRKGRVAFDERAEILDLQRSAGNGAVSRMIQAKLEVSGPEDESEREADRVAEEVSRVAVPGREGADSSPQVSANSGSTGPELRLEGAPGGTPLPDPVRSSMEDRFGQGLGGVRIHTGAEAARASRDLDARAFTYGSNIYFGGGEFSPESPSGRKLLAHELTHVVQQGNGAGAGPPRVSRKTKGEEVKDKADVFLSAEASLKAEVDVLKAALREVKKGKSVKFNKDAGLKRAGNAAAVLKLDAAKTKALKDEWEWLVDNAGKAGTKGYVAKEKRFFGDLKSPIEEIGERFPNTQTKYRLKNSPPQIIDIIIKVADSDLPADQLYTYAVNEGVVDYVRGQIGLGKTDSPTSAQLAGVSTTTDVSGFDFLGLDDFMTDLAATREPLSGFLPSGFDQKKLTPEDRENEKGRTVKSAVFPNMTMGIQALAASLKRRRKLFQEDRKANGYAAPTTDELVYWTYLYFNPGEFAGKGQLEKYKGKRKLSDWITAGEYGEALKVLRNFQMLKELKIF